MKVQELLALKREEYGDTWLIVGNLITLLHIDGYLNKILQTTFSLNWFMILTKLIRLLNNPYKKDSWQDIEGYARLVSEKLTGDTNGE